MLDFPLIDAHVHLLDQKRFSYSWASGAPSLARDWTLNDLMRAAKPYVIEGAVFVEVDVDMPQYLDEAAWVDGLATSDKRLKGAVVALPLERGPALEPEIARVAALKATRGVRRLLQNQPDDFMLQPDFLAALKLLPKYNLSFDICIFHRQLKTTLEMVRRCPDVSFVLDHIGKPGIAAGLTQPWKSEIDELARLPNVVAVKLSGVTTEADHENWTPAQLRPYMDWVFDRFGPQRVMYGGDWPVSTLAGDYLQWLTTLEAAVSDFTEGERRNLFGDIARRIYRL